MVSVREIKFRGKSKLSIDELDKMGFEHKGGWIYGNLIVNGKKPYIVGDLVEVDPEYIVHEFWAAVYPGSVEQYTGLKDKNGVEVYEGDIVQFTVNKFSGNGIEKIVENGEVYYTEDMTLSVGGWILAKINSREIIGNIYENPELLEVSK